MGNADAMMAVVAFINSRVLPTILGGPALPVDVFRLTLWALHLADVNLFPLEQSYKRRLLETSLTIYSQAWH
jgi:hypothetical protein